MWARENGLLPADRATDDGRGLLVITSVRAEDSGTYVCTATVGRFVKTETAVLNVAGLLHQSTLVQCSESIYYTIYMHN